jgi:hypothetical protein
MAARVAARNRADLHAHDAAIVRGVHGMVLRSNAQQTNQVTCIIRVSLVRRRGRRLRAALPSCQLNTVEMAAVMYGLILNG